MKTDVDFLEMPVTCQNCNTVFDLNDGCGSEKWYPNTVICEDCSKIEQQEIELDDEIEECKLAISDAEFTLNEQRPYLIELQEKMLKIQSKRDNP